MAEKISIHQLPLAKTTLQHALRRLPLAEQPSAQRRSTTFTPSTPGVWARVYPMWTAWPLRLTRADVEAMGVDIDKGEQVDVEDVLARWDAIEEVPENSSGGESSTGNGLKLMTSKHRDQLESILLGVSPGALKGSLPHLDVGDALEVCNEEASASSSSSSSGKAREALMDLLSGRRVLVSADAKVSSGTSSASNGDEENGQNSRPQIDPAYGPWSTRYDGHQFGVWAGQLGDGRATSILETESPGGGRQEIQLKGAGRTPFSRTADGLAVLRSGVREFLGCEAIAGLGIPTTRSLALLTTPNLPVIRENGAEPPSLLARLAPTFIRLGHFEALNPGKAGRDFRQIFLGGGWQNDGDEDAKDGPLEGQGNLEGLRELTEWCKSLMGFEGKPTKEWVKDVVRRNAEMVAGWQVYGFMHGVLNSDNISIMGLTIDYGPYAFMDIWNEGHICNHSDPSGLYSYRRQPERVLFDLDKLVSAVSPIIGYEALHGAPSEGWSESISKEDVEEWNDKAKEEMKGWEKEFMTVEKQGELRGWMKRFGLRTYQDSDDRDIFFDFFTLLHTHSVDFHSSFRILSTFQPSQAENKDYLKDFASNWADSCTLDLSSDAKSQAVGDLVKWLDVYANRVLQPEHVLSWVEEEVPTDSNNEKPSKLNNGAHALNGSNGEVHETLWEHTREEAMKSVNPRFILRQWILEEVIAEMEEAGLEDIPRARRALARVLHMSANPFEDYFDDGSEEGSKRARLCGMGPKAALGFQCSCSS